MEGGEEKSSDGVRFEKLNADYGNCFCFELGKEVDSRRDADERKSANFGRLEGAVRNLSGGAAAVFVL